MKANIHPAYQQITITCVGCGTTYATGSTVGRDAKVDICSKCHPFYTGQKKLIDTEGRVEKFTKRTARATEQRQPKKAVVATPGKSVAAPTPAQKPADRPKSLREMLQDAANNR